MLSLRVQTSTLKEKKVLTNITTENLQNAVGEDFVVQLSSEYVWGVHPLGQTDKPPVAKVIGKYIQMAAIDSFANDEEVNAMLERIFDHIEESGGPRPRALPG